MSRATVVTKAGAALCATCMLLLAGCGGSDKAATTKDGKPIVTVQVIKDSRMKKMTDQAWTKSLEKACGCSINWQEVGDPAWDQQKKASLAAGDVPDINIRGFGSGDMSEYGSLFLDLTPELKNMPNVSKMFKEDPYSKAISTTTDGKILGVPGVAGAVYPRSSTHMFINKTWLDKLGLKVPTTWDELHDVLKAFKTQDPNGNGEADEIPMDFNSPGTGGFGLFQPNVLLASEGITVPNGALGMYAENGKVKNYLTDARYKKLIQYLHTLWSENLINPEAFTHDWSKFINTTRGDGKTAKVGVTWMYTPEGTFGTENQDQYITIPTLKASENQSEKTVSPFNGDELAYMPDRVVVSAKVKNKDAALKIVDALYSADLSVESRYGSFGEAVKKNGTDDYTIIPKPENGDWQFQVSMGDRAPGWINDKMKLNLPSIHTAYHDVDGVYDEDYKNIDFNKDVLYANMPMTSDQSKTLNANYTGITQGAMSKFANWVTKGGVDDEWDTYVESLKKNKLDENIRIEQQVYDSFKKNMRKMDVDMNNVAK
ncbi:extracellular solute-binding protein [Bifidobacterium bombi]|uniref:ABC transporter, solute-binding protein n=1 Tax=Bifidobacterium bombi DSM 19703 TaxID=1341695 RepID=A0A080N5T6_9BIFI|nr:extracellular solute-binding protein [Bifidobacterium bombi]KFF30979.1 ABC transporter, solute-binding protein [Bifidobacterium bombi DSM 19703]